MRINEITQEQKVEIKCLISKCDKGKTVKDTPYLSLILEDATGILDAKFWNLTNEQIEQYKAGQIVHVFGDSIIHRNAVQLRIRKMTSRWGVCNVLTHIITLNLELIKRDTKYLDYVIVHELSHLIHGDHSDRFWKLVEDNMPDYRKYREEMKEF